MAGAGYDIGVSGSSSQSSAARSSIGPVTMGSVTFGGQGNSTWIIIAALAAGLVAFIWYFNKK